MANRSDPSRPAERSHESGAPTGHRDIVVIGASAGGIGALQQVVHGLPADFPASVFIVLHIPPDGHSTLPHILARAGVLPVRSAVDGDAIEPGIVYVAPPDVHLIVKRGVLRLGRGPRENGSRPSVDALFRTAAVAYGRRVLGVVLSGNLGDGTAGLSAVKRRGGMAIVQHPDDAAYPGMPTSALEQVADVDHVVTLDAMPALLDRLVREPVPDDRPAAADATNEELDIAEMTDDSIRPPDHRGTPSGFGCPECGGVLFTMDGEIVRFRCRVGHAWSGESLLGQQSQAMEDALWIALRALEEQQALSLQVAERFARRGHSRGEARFRAQAALAGQHSLVLRDVLQLPRATAAADVAGAD